MLWRRCCEGAVAAEVLQCYEGVVKGAVAEVL